VTAYLMVIRFKLPPWLQRGARRARRHGRVRVHEPVYPLRPPSVAAEPGARASAPAPRGEVLPAENEQP